MYYASEIPIYFALIPLVIGVISCFWGYRLFRVILGIVGFICAGSLAGSFAFGLSGGSIIITVIAAVVGAVAGAFLVSVFYYLGVFALGAAGGWMLGIMAAGMAGYASSLVVGVVSAVLCGILAVVFQRIIIIVATASVGSWNIIAALYFLAGGTFYSPFVFWNPGWIFDRAGSRYSLLFVIWLALAFAGIVFQLRFGRKRRIEKNPAA